MVSHIDLGISRRNGKDREDAMEPNERKSLAVAETEQDRLPGGWAQKREFWIRCS
jgi:hypothetical protein